MTTPGARLRAAWSAGPIMIPGAFNALAAKMVERIGFQAVYLSGGALSAGWAGLPDIGLLTQTEFAEQAAVLARATSLPVLCDADTGFGEAINVERTVRLYEEAGVAGLHLEDQVLPKRCGHLSGKSLIDSRGDGGKDPSGRLGPPRSRFRDRGPDRRAKRGRLRRGRPTGARVSGRGRRHDLSRSPGIGRGVRSLSPKPSMLRSWPT